MRLGCFYCGKSVSTEVPDDTVFRAVAECPECAEKNIGQDSHQIEQLRSRIAELLTALKRVREAFYVNGKASALRAAFEGTKELLEK